MPLFTRVWKRVEFAVEVLFMNFVEARSLELRGLRCWAWMAFCETYPA